jgi:hypothetical protein
VKESEVSQSAGSEKKHEAGAFDVRNIIGGLIGLYGIVLVIVGLVDKSHAAMAKTGGVNANLWAGIVMVVVAAAFAAWSRIRPIVVTARPEETDDPS